MASFKDQQPFFNHNIGVQTNKWSTFGKTFMILLSSITVSGDMRFSKFMVFTCYKLKAAVEAKVEVKKIHESNFKR